MNHLTRHCIFLFTLLCFMSCRVPSTVGEGKVNLIAAEEFMQAYEAEPAALLIDCRTASEVSKGQVEGATHIDYRSATFTAEASKLDKSKPVYIYCQAGGRSAAAAKELVKIGFEEVYDMKGGYSVYSKE